MLKILCIIVVVILIGICLLYAFPFAKVQGRSMYPTFKEGGLLLATRLFNRNKLEIGKVYVYKRIDEDGREYLVVKRLTNIVSLPHKGFNYLLYFEGDNAEESYDSRQYGFINAENIIAKVLWQVKE